MSGARPGRIAMWRTWDKAAVSDDLWSWQDGRCAWCGYDRVNLVRDHCHMTGLIRGLLCAGCNTNEGHSSSDAWDEWRGGENTANAIGHFEIYENHLGHTSYSPQSALHYFSFAEREAWYELVVAKLNASEIDWPTKVPWIDTAVERKAADYRQMQEAMSAWPLGLAPSPDGRAVS